MAVLPVWPDAEQSNCLHLVELNLIVAQLAGARQPARQASLARTLGARTVPAKEFELIRRLVPVGPLNGQQPAGPVGEDVERPLAVGGIYSQVLV